MKAPVNFTILRKRWSLRPGQQIDEHLFFILKHGNRNTDVKERTPSNKQPPEARIDPVNASYALGDSHCDKMSRQSRTRKRLKFKILSSIAMEQQRAYPILPFKDASAYDKFLDVYIPFPTPTDAMLSSLLLANDVAAIAFDLFFAVLRNPTFKLADLTLHDARDVYLHVRKYRTQQLQDINFRGASDPSITSPQTYPPLFVVQCVVDEFATVIADAARLARRSWTETQDEDGNSERRQNGAAARDDLKSMSLVHSSWAPLAQYALGHVLKLNDVATLSMDLVLRNPICGLWTREVTLAMPRGQNTDFLLHQFALLCSHLPNLQFLMLGAARSVVQRRDFWKALPNLNQLTEMVLDASEAGLHDYTFLNLSNCTEFCEYVRRLPALKSLRLFEFMDTLPPDLLQQSISLKTIIAEVNSYVVKRGQRVPRKKIAVSWSRTVASCAFCPPSMIIHRWRNSPRHDTAKIKHLQRIVESLSISCGDRDDIHSELVAEFHALRTLVVKGLLFVTQQIWTALPKSLERFSFESHFDCLWQRDWKSWDEHMCEILTPGSTRSCPNLQHIEMVVRIINCQGVDDAIEKFQACTTFPLIENMPLSAAACQTRGIQFLCYADKESDRWLTSKGVQMA